MPNLALLALEASDGTVVLTSITLVFAMLIALCLIITLGQNYEAFLKDTIDWGGVAATYIGIPLFLVIWFGYKLAKGTRFVRYSDMTFPDRFKR